MAAVYLSIRRLCLCCYPVKVERRDDDITLMIVDPTATRLEILDANARLLTDSERLEIRAAYGQPPMGRPLADGMCEGLCLPYVPPALRVPGEPAVQVVEPDDGPELAAWADAMLWWGEELDARTSRAS